MPNAFDAAIDRALSRAQLDDLAQLLWRALAAGEIDEAEAERIGARIHSRQTGARRDPQRLRVRGSTRTGPTRSPDRQARLERRRRLAASGPMPPALAAKFTTGQMAVLRVVADEVRERGSCDRCIDELARRAGVSRSTARNAIREARQLGLLAVQERRRPGDRSLTNIITMVSREWQTWLTRGPKGGGSKFQTTLKDRDIQRARQAGLSATRMDRNRLWRTCAEPTPHHHPVIV
jgi:transposase